MNPPTISEINEIQRDNEILQAKMCDAWDYEIQRDDEHKEDTRR